MQLRTMKKNWLDVNNSSPGAPGSVSTSTKRKVTFLFNVYKRFLNNVLRQNALLMFFVRSFISSYYIYEQQSRWTRIRCLAVVRVPTGQGKLENVMEFEWPGKVRERSGEIFLVKSGKSHGE